MRLPQEKVCRHLGLADDAARQYSFPTPDHRCHLTPQREQIDLAHQQRFCLTQTHQNCPWLVVQQRPSPYHSLQGRTLAQGAGVIGLLAATVVLLLAGRSRLSGATPQSPSRPAVSTPSTFAETDPSPTVDVQASDGTLPFGALTPSLLTARRPASVSRTVASATGGAVVAGNMGLSFSPKALSGTSTDVTVRVQVGASASVPGGPAQFSPDGSIADISVRDAAGRLVTTFPEPVEILVKYNSADVAMARGDARELRAAYVIDENSPTLENPNHFPVGTWVLFPPSSTELDALAGTLRVRTQAIGSIFSVVAVSVGWAQVVPAEAQLYSSFDPATSMMFGALKRGSYVRMVEPQIGSRLLVLNLATGNYAYIDARNLKPSGPPPPASSPPDRRL